MNLSTGMWHPAPSRTANCYVAFRGSVRLEQAGLLKLRLFGCDTYRLFAGGTDPFGGGPALLDGPARFAGQNPEYDELDIETDREEIELRVVVHFYGVPKRMSTPGMPAFLAAEAFDGYGASVPIRWQCRELEAFRDGAETAFDDHRYEARRISALLGWSETVDTRLLGESFWTACEAWRDPAPVQTGLSAANPALAKSIRSCGEFPAAGLRLANGVYSDRCGYADDDPPVRFMLRDLQPKLPPEGVWFRFDLGLVALFRPVLTIDVPEGTVVEIGYNSELQDDRVHPVIYLAASQSCHMDRWIARGGEQVLTPFSPRGFRFCEVHIAAPSELVNRVDLRALQRSYFGEPAGSFSCSDERLNRIWRMSVDTLRACSEDALTDTPTRERGQWLADAVLVGIETLRVAYGDYTLIRRSLEQAALCKREDGLVASQYPGQPFYLSSFALLWIGGCVRYSLLTGDRTLLEEQYDTAVGVMNLYRTLTGPYGTRSPEGSWDFVDWGHIVDEGFVNVALNLILLQAIRDMKVWEDKLGGLHGQRWRRDEAELEAIVRSKFLLPGGLPAKAVRPVWTAAGSEAESPGGEPGYHATVLALRLGLLEGETRQAGIRHIRHHMLQCFPNKEEAPRLAHPLANDQMLITPYFGHFALEALMLEGEEAFVLDQYRVCWGWMLDYGATTLLEVFDPRWSHCHAWSGCPAWQLSTHVLGLIPVAAGFDGEPDTYILHPRFGDLTAAEGTLPALRGDGLLTVAWKRTGEGVALKLTTTVPIRLLLDERLAVSHAAADGEPVTVRRIPLLVQSELAIGLQV